MTPAIQLAPMEGVLDPILREMLSQVGGFDRMVTEFVRVTDRLLPDHVFRKYCPELETDGKTANGTPVFIQLLGGRPEWLAENAARAVAIGAPGIDLNFGCPAKTVNRHDGGATLLKNPERVFQVVSAVRKAVQAQIPVTAKVRLGFDHKELHKEIAQAAEDGGASHLVVHARTKTEMYQRPAHWAYIRSMREGRSIPFLANGDIWSIEDYQHCRDASGVDAVALGRGVVRRPTLAREIRQVMEKSGAVTGLAPTGGLDAIKIFNDAEFVCRFTEKSQAARGEAFATARLKQLLRYWSDNQPHHADWFQTVKTMQRYEQVRNFMSDLGKDKTCQKFRFTPGPTAPTAFEPRISFNSAN